MTESLIAIYIFFGFACIFASLTVCLPSAFASALTANLFSASCAILYFFLNSPDVSMTEVSIGVFLSTTIYLMTARVVRVESLGEQSKFKFIFSVFLFFVLTFLLYEVMLNFGEFGNIKGVIKGSGGMQLIASYRDFQIPNTITTILASYRSFDTMGETTIIFTASIGIFLILGMRNSKFSQLT